MLKVGIIVLAFAICLFRYLFFYQGKKGNFLVLSCFILVTGFQYAFTVMNGEPLGSAEGGGTLGPDVRIVVAEILCVCLFPFVKFKKNTHNKSYWIKIVIGFILLSIINPYNKGHIPTFEFALFFLCHILLFEELYSLLTKDEVIKGIYDGFLILCAFQFPLAIAFPLLKMTSVTTYFQDAAEILSTRKGQRDGAVGIFIHPGMMAVFMIIASAFFLGCYLSKYRKKMSLLILITNTIVLVLTFSRTAYLVYVFELFAVIFVFKNAAKPIFSILNLFRFVLPVCLALYWLVFFSPLSDQFLASNINDMAQARLTFYKIGYKLFQESPILGVGLNAHRDYLHHNPNLIKMFSDNSFFFDNPIHNISLIVLVETGIVGFCCWIVFLARSFFKAKNDVAEKKNMIFSLTFIGIILGYFVYGMTGWAPFAPPMLPFFLMFTFFAIRYRGFA